MQSDRDRPSCEIITPTFRVLALLLLVLPDRLARRVALLRLGRRQNLVLFGDCDVELVDARVDVLVRLTSTQVPATNTHGSTRSAMQFRTVVKDSDLGTASNSRTVRYSIDGTNSVGALRLICATLGISGLAADGFCFTREFPSQFDNKGVKARTFFLCIDGVTGIRL